MDKVLFFDAGPIISLVMSRMWWLLPKLKEQFGGKFYITPAVKFELIDRPLQTKRFAFEALQVMKLIREGTLEVYTNVPEKKVGQLIKLANSTFKIKGKSMDIIQEGEVQSVACALELNAPLVMDERTLRLFIENGKEMKSLLEHRFHKTVVADNSKIDLFQSQLKDVTIIRSAELVSVAYKLGLLDLYVPKKKAGRSVLIDSMLWAVKFSGCAVTEHEIDEIKNELLR
ncbi:hypothetical protein HQ489_03560 [Candidatus Woesearchaeota archaeon]|nr:hypothetical protein [Candidatus Woesearchaeota archaeon]